MPDIARLKIVAANANLRSQLARWLTANRDEFAKMLKDYRPRWEPLVEWFGEEGLLALPPEFFAQDEALRAMTRRKVVRATMRTWERVNAARGVAARGVAAVQENPAGKQTVPARGSLRDRMKPIRIERNG